MQEREDFERLMQHRHEVARSYVNGDPGPLGKNVADSNPATFFAHPSTCRSAGEQGEE